ncbi:MAG: glycosyltransferase [Cytophagales bacterium]|nr:MAG: glycosyltransferase [Cytophagales bacterium]
MFFAITFIIFYTFYFVFVAKMHQSWQQIDTFDFDKKNTFTNKISIVVAFKNEEKNLPQLLQSIENQSVSKFLFEVIFINDHSSDKSVEIIEKHISQSKLTIFLIQAVGIGKKQALSQAFANSKNQIILCTDADCNVPTDWVKTWLHFFEDSKIKLGFGLVAFKDEKTFFSSLNTIEFASLVGSGAATWALGKPTMCNGANLAYRKTTFNEVNGFDGINNQPSGDDELLMHKIFASQPDAVRFLKSKSAIVFTEATQNLSSFYNQRLRWASKWENYQLPHVQAIAFSIFATNLILILFFITLFFDFNFIKFILFCVFQLTRMIIEYRFLHSILYFLDKKLNLSAFLFLFIIYPFYVVFFGLGGRFLSYKWKK